MSSAGKSQNEDVKFSRLSIYQRQIQTLETIPCPLLFITCRFLEVLNEAFASNKDFNFGGKKQTALR